MRQPRTRTGPVCASVLQLLLDDRQNGRDRVGRVFRDPVCIRRGVASHVGCGVCVVLCLPKIASVRANSSLGGCASSRFVRGYMGQVDAHGGPVRFALPVYVHGMCGMRVQPGERVDPHVIVVVGEIAIVGGELGELLKGVGVETTEEEIRVDPALDTGGSVRFREAGVGGPVGVQQICVTVSVRVVMGRHGGVQKADPVQSVHVRVDGLTKVVEAVHRPEHGGHTGEIGRQHVVGRTGDLVARVDAREDVSGRVHVRDERVARRNSGLDHRVVVGRG